MLEKIQAAASQVGRVVVGKQPQIRLALACLLARGHLLIEDLPGVGKTTLAHALSISLGLEFSRTQFTNDLLPADITGTTVFDRDTASLHLAGEFRHQRADGIVVDRALAQAEGR